MTTSRSNHPQPSPDRFLPRRRLLAAAPILAASAALGGWAATAITDDRRAPATAGTLTARTLAATTAAAGPQLSLPRPSGRYPVGTRSLHLVDRSRIDPLAPDTRYRELMVKLWYPAGTSQGASAPYLPAGVSQVLVEQLNAENGTSYPDGLLTFGTDARQVAPAIRPGTPLVLFSPGQGFNAELYTGLLTELASRGYVVAGITCTFDAVVEFPGGRVVLPNPNAAEPSDSYLMDSLLPTQVADARFVLSELIPRLRPGPVAATGHSLGSITAIEVIAADRRVSAGIALDGNPLNQASLDRPFMMMGAASTHLPADDPDWAAFYARLRGRRLYQVVDGIGHDDFTDITIFKSMATTGPGFIVGPLAGNRALFIERTYVRAWLDFALTGRRSPLLGTDSPQFPEVEVEAASL